MFCKKCGAEIQEVWTVCPNCGESINGMNDFQKIPAIQNQKKKKSVFKKWWFWVIIVVVIFGFIQLLGSDESEVLEAEFGKPITVENIAHISFSEGAFCEGAVYPQNATDENAGIEYDSEGVMYGIYGVVENLSGHKFDVNKVIDVVVKVDGKYESDAEIWLENEEQTEFNGLGIDDEIFLSPDAVLNPKDKFHCVLVGQVGTEVYKDAKEATIEIKILKDLDNAEEYVTYKMPLTVEEN